jgi:vacuolar-type H+-ATPase subunit I/STV1
MAKSKPDTTVVEAQTKQVVEVRGPDEKQNTEVVDRFLVAAQNHVIVDTPSLQVASDLLMANRKEQKALDEQRTFLVAPLNEHVKAINSKFKPWTEVLGFAEKLLRGKISAYQAEEQRRLNVLRAEAEEKARQERLKLEAKADKLREQGKIERASVLEDQAAATVAVVPQMVKVSGIGSKQVWTGRITDMKAFCGAIASGELPETLVNVSQADLNRLALTYKTTRTFPGLVLEQVSQTVSR